MSLIKEFFNTFGTDMTTNFDLIKYAKLLKIKPFQYIMSDEINKLPKGNFNCIMNYQLSHQQGTHHVALVRKENTLYYFDSYGMPIQKHILDFFKGSNLILRSHDYQFQTVNDKYCGQISLFVIYLLNNNYEYHDIISMLKDKFFVKNDKL